MPQSTLTRRVAILEEKVTSLEHLPERMERVELQIVQLREEMRSEFSAVRAEIQSGFEAVREEFRTVRQEMREGDEETRGYMRVLHEDVIARIAAIGELPRPPRKRR